MSDVFIAYSRKDTEFVRKLVDSLYSNGIEDIWVDWEDIPPTADWMKEIQAGIDGANTFIFIISPDSVASEICMQELNYAIENNKRLIPVLHREIDRNNTELQLPHALVILTWIFMRDENDFEQNIQSLVDVITTDPDYLQVHTRMLTRAIEWENQGRNEDYLLRGSELVAAENWLSSSDGKEPMPTELHRAYIIESRERSGNPLSRLFGGFGRQRDNDTSQTSSSELEQPTYSDTQEQSGMEDPFATNPQTEANLEDTFSSQENADRQTTGQDAQYNTRIYISYRTTSQDWTGDLYNRLSDYFDSQNIFFAEQGIAAGDDWQSVTFNRLLSSEVVIVALDETTAGSNWVQRDIDMARARGISILPLMMEGNGINFGDILPALERFQLEQLQVFMFNDDPDTLDELVQTIQSLATITAEEQAKDRQRMMERPADAPSRIFLTFRNSDTSAIVGDMIHDHLSSTYEVFNDKWDIAPGQNWQTVLFDNLIASDVVIVILDDDTVDSDWTQRDLDIARARNISILPVSVADYNAIQPALERFLLTNYQFVDFDVSNPEASLQQITNRIATLTEQTRTTRNSSAGQPVQRTTDAPDSDPGVDEPGIPSEPKIMRVKGEQMYNPFLHADRTGQQDLLDIAPDVEALATLIAADNTPLPLAVGIFGKWGSGKTFFMSKLQDKIRELSDMPLPSDPESPIFYPEIAQIQFNAWHYVEGNLWAGLVEHIFRKLDERDDLSEDEQHKLLKTLEFQREAIARAEKQKKDSEAELRTAKASVLKKEKELEDAKKKLKLKPAEQLAAIKESLASDTAIKDEVEKFLVNMKASEVGIAREQLLNAHAKAFEETSATAKLLTESSKEEKFWVMVSAIVIFAVMIGLAWINSQNIIDSVGETIVAIVAAIAPITVFLRQYTGIMRRIRAEFDRKHQHIENVFNEKYQQQLKEIDDFNTITKPELEAEIQEAETQKANAESIIAETQQKLDDLRPDRLLFNFIQDRTSSDDYRKHLGIPAVIRHDLEKLSNAIKNYNEFYRQQRKAENNSTSPDVPPQGQPMVNLNRIVLYIDDLDRCPPEIVVRVLEAVHLISAFEAFVVVVGVDLYWLQKALNVHIKGMPIDAASYLKKIFQIPLWLLPMSEQATQNYLEGLLLDNVIEDKPDPVPVVNREAAVKSTRDMIEAVATGDPEKMTTNKPQPAATIAADNDRPIAPVNTPPQPSEPQPQPRRTGEIPVTTIEQAETNLAALRTGKQELAFMKSLAAIIGSSPREVKRFINLYRLHKVSQARTADSVRFRDDQFEVILVMLAIFVGKDIASDYLLRTLNKNSEIISLQQLLDETVENLEKPARFNLENDSNEERQSQSKPERIEAARREIEMIRRCIGNRGDLLQADVSRIAHQIARYSFELVG